MYVYSFIYEKGMKVITSGSPMKEIAAGLFGMTTTALQQ